jgi:hypothetical protein
MGRPAEKSPDHKNDVFMVGQAHKPGDFGILARPLASDQALALLGGGSHFQASGLSLDE